RRKTPDRFALRVEGLEHGQELRDRQEIRNALGQVEQLETAALPADGRVRADNLAEARAVYVRHVREIQNDLFVALIDEAVHLVLQQLIALAQRDLAFQVEYNHVTDVPFLDLHVKTLPKYALRASLTPAYAATQRTAASAWARRSAAREGGHRRAEPFPARRVVILNRREKIDQWSLNAASARELAGLEAFLAEHGAPLRRLEGDRRLLPARRARRDGFHPLPRHAGAGRTGRALAFTGLAPLRLVLEVLVGEELLLSRRPDELRS